MTTIAVVRKNGVAAIAADTLTKWGPAKESAAYVVNHTKILGVGENLLAVTGNATFKHIIEDYFGGDEPPPILDSVAAIFRTWNRMHGDFKEHYFLQAEEDKEEAIESTRIDVLIANPHGIFGVSGQRTVQEFSTLLRVRQRQQLRDGRTLVGLRVNAAQRRSHGAPRHRTRRSNSTMRPGCRSTHRKFSSPLRANARADSARLAACGAYNHS